MAQIRIPLLVALLCLGCGCHPVGRRVDGDYKARLAQRLSAEGDPAKSITAEEIRDYAVQDFSAELMFTRFVLGTHNGAVVVADYPWSDKCPDHTVRIVYYDVPDDRCEAVGGTLRPYTVPNGIGADDVTFCFPAVLVDHWGEFVERSNLFMSGRDYGPSPSPYSEPDGGTPGDERASETSWQP